MKTNKPDLLQKTIHIIYSVGEIYRLVLKSGLSIGAVSKYLNKMRKEHNKTPKAKVDRAFLTNLCMDSLDKKSKKILDDGFDDLMLTKEGNKK